MQMTKHLANASGTLAHSEDFPDLDDAGLAARLRQSISTIRSWRSRSPEKLPPGVRVGRVWLYRKETTEEWLAARHSMHGSRISSEQTAAPTRNKRRGKPSNAEIAAASKAGLTVPAWRAQQQSLLSTKVTL